MPTEPQQPRPDPLEPTSPVEVPRPAPPVGVPAPVPDTIAPPEPEGLPVGSPQEQPPPPDPPPGRET